MLPLRTSAFSSAASASSGVESAPRIGSISSNKRKVAATEEIRNSVTVFPILLETAVVFPAPTCLLMETVAQVVAYMLWETVATE